MTSAQLVPEAEDQSYVGSENATRHRLWSTSDHTQTSSGQETYMNKRKLGLEIKKTKQKKTHSKEDNPRATIEVDVVRHVKFEQCFRQKDEKTKFKKSNFPHYYQVLQNIFP